MVVLIVILTFVVFVGIDLSLRFALKRWEEARIRKERREALDIGLRLEFADEAASLTRVEVADPKAKLLAVDDERVVLDSFRKILVLEGFSVDTVETGPEALGLVRKHDYDFVFTDLKMPNMDGIEVTKAVKHLRPDIDVVMITGYATVESAVETMKHGATDYVQKPFTANELADFARKLLIRRQARIEAQSMPQVRLLTTNGTEEKSPRVINVPGGVYVSPQHVWVGVDMNGEVRVGLDDFVRKVLVDIDDVEFPTKGQRVATGTPLFSIKRGERRLTFVSPVSGRVSKLNHEITYYLDILRLRSFSDSWICCIQPETLGSELPNLKIGADALPLYEHDIRSFRQALATRESGGGAATLHDNPDPKRALHDREWDAFSSCFLKEATR